MVWLQHGNPTWSFLWRKVIAALDPTRFRCIAPDMLGLGLSSKLPSVEDHSLERHIAAMTTLLEGLELRDIIFVGQDWGGPIVAGLGANAPERVAGMVLANTSVLVPPRPRGTAFHRFAHMPVISDLVFRGLGFPQIGLGVAQGDRRSISGEVARAYMWPLRHMADRAAPLALARMVPNGPDHPSLPALRRGEAWARGFQGPTALVWGRNDPILGHVVIHHLRAFPKASITHTMAGHFLQEEVPEQLARAVEHIADQLDAR